MYCKSFNDNNSLYTKWPIFFFAFLLIVSFQISFAYGADKQSINSQSNIIEETQAVNTQSSLLEETQPVRGSPGYRDSGGMSYANYNFTAIAEPRKPLRNSSATLNLIFKNNESYESLTVQSIKFNLLPELKVVKAFVDNKLDWNFFEQSSNTITIKQFDIQRKTVKIFSYKIFIPKYVDTIKSGIISNPEVVIQRHHSSSSNEHYFVDVDIQNNPPKIYSANVYFPLNQIKPYDNKTLQLVGNASNPIDIRFNILAQDIEDGNKLCSSGLIRDQDGENILEENLTISNTSKFNINDLKPSKMYSLWAKVKDKNNDTSELKANISYSGRYYQNILIPDIHFIERTAAFLSFALSLIVIIITYLLFRSRRCHRFCPYIVFAISILIVISYIWLFNFGPIFLPLFNNFIYIDSLPILEFVIYIIIFSIIVYFTQICFSLEFEDIPHHSLGIISTLMLLTFIIFMSIIPKIENLSCCISGYYSTMATVFGTIFSLIVILSGQFPRNIITFRTRSTDRDFFSYHKNLRYFVAVYGTALGLSLLGLVAGTNLKLNILIVGSNIVDIIVDIIPVILFEITLLLIAPTIISLYKLLEVIAFRGKITIKSDPQGPRSS